MELDRRHQADYSVDGVERMEGAVAVLDLYPSKGSAYTRWEELRSVRFRARLSLAHSVFQKARGGCA